ncbi:glyoxalase [Blastococcus sp. CT_GayMR20]|uniref:VOC family protein n=1 Tax=Blastococcus sp. CT_GayMR20 TaxID=2559609 RepID=UPI001073A91B|nr:VOC family protein [Blastococcus sp. CT_GayMR20]TFV70329.1 glyoxalase [Blastococcus sp. CT_GayMR20]TFV70334.1 glyoxalase [Blastococcus sp. CT_GayMR20]
MSDAERPFRALARRTSPVEPDPTFAAELRERLRRALLQQPTPVQPRSSAMSALTPYLVVRDARAALAWYAEVFGARTVGDPYVDEDDRIGHAELDVAGATLYLADPYPELGLTGPEDGRVAVTLHLAVPDVDAAVARAEAAGATVERPAADAPYGRTGVVVDPYGHRWMLQHPTPAPSSGPRPGDAVYLTLQVPDGARARDFYEAVLGWAFTPGRVQDGWQVEGTTPMVGLHGGDHTDLGVIPMYAVDDIEVAVAAVRTAGGEAGEIERQSYGRSALCRDDQGLPFWLGQF